ncbi:7455_t:CDS:2, partial [Dentiscutata erythropus]
AEVDDIENFLFDYKGYAKAKKYNEETTCFKTSLKTKISEKIKAENEPKIKILRLKHLKQEEKKLVREYMNRYEAHIEHVNTKLRLDEKCDWYIKGLREPFRSKVENCCSKDYKKAKKKALGMDEYKREKNQEHEGERSKDLVNELAALEINRIEQEAK